MYESLVKGLAIYRQNHTKSYYVRLRIDKKEIKRTLSTSDLDEAKSKAWAFKFDMEGRKSAGLPILETKEMTVNHAFKQVIKDLNSKKVQKPIYSDYQHVINNFIIPYFKNKTIKDMTTKNIRQYFESLELSGTRYNINKTCFSKLFIFLEEEELLKKSELPTLPKADKNTAEMRDAFSKADHDIITEELKKYHTIGRPNFKTKEYRQTLYHYFNFLCETGVRPGIEVGHLKFSDFKKESDNYHVSITKGKTAKNKRNGRSIAISQFALESLIEIAKIQNPDKKITEKNYCYIDKPVLESSFGTIPCYSSKFGDFRKSLIKNNLISKEYVLYSCRHYFITKRLSQSVDIYLIAKYVGNSVEMIQKFYDDYKLNSQQHIDQLTGRDRVKEEEAEYNRMIEADKTDFQREEAQQAKAMEQQMLEQADGSYWDDYETLHNSK